MNFYQTNEWNPCWNTVCVASSALCIQFHLIVDKCMCFHVFLVVFFHMGFVLFCLFFFVKGFGLWNIVYMLWMYAIDVKTAWDTSLWKKRLALKRTKRRGGVGCNAFQTLVRAGLVTCRAELLCELRGTHSFSLMLELFALDIQSCSFLQAVLSKFAEGFTPSVQFTQSLI